MALPNVERVSLYADGLRLAAEVHAPDGQGPYPALCICHGIPAGRTPDPSDRGYPLLAEMFSGAGFVVLIFNFRGAGESEGNLDMLGWTRDLKAAVDYLHGLDVVDRSRFSVMGFSMGAAITIYCAANDTRISSVVSCACPARFPVTPEFSGTGEFLEHCRRIGTIRDKDFPPSVEEWASGFEQVTPGLHVHKISPRPILIVHGGSDATVDPGHARELYEMAGDPKDIAIVEGGEHKLRLSEPAMNAALSWLKRVNGLAEAS